MVLKVGDYLIPKQGMITAVYKCIALDKEIVTLKVIISPLGVGEIHEIGIDQTDYSYRVASRQELIDEGVISQSLDFIKHI